MTPPHNNLLPRFFLRTLLWLPVFFVLWYYLAWMFSFIPALASKGLLNLLFDHLIISLDTAGRSVEYVTRLTVEAKGGTGNVVVTVNPLIYSWNIPVLLALCFAVEDRYFSNGRVVLAVLGLLPLHIWGICAETITTLAFRQGPEVAAQFPLLGWQQELAAFAYQFGYLMLPVIGAVSLWIASQRHMVQALVERRAE